MRGLRGIGGGLTAAIVAASSLASATPLDEMRAAFQKKQWAGVSQAAYDALRQDPRNSEARIKGAYALFQQGLANSALVMLRHLTPEQWKSVPQGDDRFVEIVTLLQKKVPLNLLSGKVTQLNENGASASLRDEILFAKGREAYEQGNAMEATHFLGMVSPGSRYFSQARYLLGALAVLKPDYEIASIEMGRVFEPTLYQQSTEFWKDLQTEITAQWGASLKVFLDPTDLAKTKKVGELAIMGQARIHYAKKDFDLALAQYDRIPKTSDLYPRARLERLWTLLQLNKHEQAQKEASSLMVDGSSFQAVEARTVRAVILADEGKTHEARAELDAFFDVYKRLNDGLQKYKNFGVTNALPEFVRYDVKNDKRVQSLGHYTRALDAEMGQLRTYHQQIYPVYQYLSSQLANLSREAKELERKITRDIVLQRLADLEKLHVQSRLIRAETFLEDRESLRKSVKHDMTDDAKLAHDARLVELLSLAVAEVDSVLGRMPKRNPFLEFRHSELLWELGNARLILAQTKDKAKNEAEGERLRSRALALAEKVVADFPAFKKRDQAMFFVGFAQLDLEKEDLAMRTFQAYVQAYPGHENVPDAYRMIGDYYFDRNQFNLATENYTKVLGFADSPVVGYAFYKIAWCLYNDREYAKAMLALEKAIIWAQQTKEAQGLLSLRREARRDLIQIYSEVGDPKKALDYFERFIGADSYSWMEDLAKVYDEAGQYEKSIYLYNVLISMNTSPEKNILHQTAILKGSFALLQWDEVVKATRELIDQYRPRLVKPMPEGDVAFDAEKVVRDASLAQHFEFKATEDAQIIERILTLDKLYFDAFGEWPSAQTPLYKHAFFLFEKSRYAEAMDAFRLHWDRFKTTLQEPTREEALRNLLNALEKVESGKEGEKKNGNGTEEAKAGPKKEEPPPNAVDAPQAGPMAVAAKDIVKYAEEYGRLYPKSENARTIAFLRATILLKYDQLDQGIAETQALFNADNKDKFGKAAFGNLRVAYYRKKDWKAAYEWATHMLASPDLGMRQYEKDLSLIREETLFLWADQTKDDMEAGALFLKAARDPRMSRLKEKSLYNAIVRFHQADDRLQVLALSEELDKVAPKSESVDKLNGIRAALYQEAGDYATALPLLEAFLKKPSPDVSEPVMHQARLNAALMYQAVGKVGDALGLYREYLAKAGSSAPGAGQAQAGIKYIEAKAKRAPAAVFKPWEGLVRTRATYEKAPIPAKGTLGARIKGGLQGLDAATKAFFDAAGAEDVSPFYAFESYCSVPFLYRAFVKGVDDLVAGLPESAREDVRKELEKVTSPMVTKGNDIAMECLRKSMESLHDGPVFREVNREWGWEKDTALKEKVASMILYLEDGAPWVEPSPVLKKEPDIILEHLKKQGNHDTWYGLARMRLESERWGLARLTLIDALAKVKADAGKAAEPKGKGKEKGEAPKVSLEGRILNALAYIEWRSANPEAIITLFEKAAEAGSHLAHVNLSLIHLKEGRLEKGLHHLRSASDGGAFAPIPALQKFVDDLLPKPVEAEK